MLARQTRKIMFAAASIVALSSLVAHAQTDGTWGVNVGTTGGNWSDPTNWVGGMIADNGGVATFNTLPFTTAPLNIIQNLPTVNISRFEFNSFITNNFTRPAATSNTITLVGPAEIRVNTPTLNILGNSFFGQQFTIPIAGTAGLVKTGPGTTTLLGTNTYSGGTTVNGGVLCLRSAGDAALGNTSGGVTLNDGTLRVNTGAWNTSRTVTMLGNGTIEAATGAPIAMSGDLTGAGAFNKAGSATLTLGFNNALTGATNALSGTLLLSGSGALASASAIVNRGTLLLDNTAANAGNRLNNSAPLTMLGSNFVLVGSAAGATSETVGNTTFDRGTGLISVNPGAGQGATIALGQVGRDHGGTAFFRGDSLGAAPAAGVANVTMAAAPTLVGGAGAAGTTNISIIPWAYGATSSGAALNANTNGLVTYGDDGVRPLNNVSEYATTIGAGVSTDNVRLTAAAVVGSASTVNALVIAGAGGVSGSGTLSITSGALLNLQNAVTVATPLNFGAAEAIVLAPSSITFSNSISGTGGLSKHGAGVATFASSASDYTGTTIIAGGTTVFVSSVTNTGGASVFGTSTDAIQLSPAGVGTGGTTARLVYGGAGTGTFARDLNVSGRIALNNAATIPGFGVNGAAALDVNGNIILDDSPLTLIGGAGSVLTINGNISGNGQLTDQASSSTSTIALKGNNTFTLGLELGSAIWQVGSDTAFGSGMLKMTHTSGSPTIMAIGGSRVVPNPSSYPALLAATYWTIAGNNDITFTGSINLSGGPYNHAITNTGLTTYAGVLHTGSFNKTGSGTLVLSGDNIHSGVTNVNAGVLRVAHTNALGPGGGATTVATGATLEMTNDSLSDEPVTINGSGIAASLGAGAIRSTSGNNSLGAVTLASASTIGVDAGSLTVGNVGGAFDLIKAGAGTLTAGRYRVTSLSTTGTAAVALGRDAANKVSTISGALAFATGASLDLGDNDLILQTATDTTIQSLIKNARDGGAWDQPGITSTAARNQVPKITTLGVLTGSEYIALNGSTFDGVTVNANDVLVRYTYYGDTDFSGLVDFDDYSRIDAGFNNNRTGWANGDVDYNGIVDFDDYSLIDMAFNNQAGTIARAAAYLDGSDPSMQSMNTPELQKVVLHFGEFGGAYASSFLSAVPEPGALLGAIALAPLLGRRLRRR